MDCICLFHFAKTGIYFEVIDFVNSPTKGGMASISVWRRSNTFKADKFPILSGRNVLPDLHIFNSFKLGKFPNAIGSPMVSVPDISNVSNFERFQTVLGSPKPE